MLLQKASGSANTVDRGRFRLTDEDDRVTGSRRRLTGGEGLDSVDAPSPLRRRS